MYELRNFITGNGKDIFDEWLEGLSDQRAHAAIMSRLDRMEIGAFGDVKSIENGVRELRIDIGAGYRIYFAQRGKTILLLLCGGDKSSQSRDINLALKYLKEFDQRTS